MKISLMKCENFYIYYIKKKENLINSTQVLSNKINTVFTSSEKSKTSDTHRLVLNLTDKIKLKLPVNIMHYQILLSAIQEKY